MRGTADRRADAAQPRTANDRSLLARRARIDPKRPVAVRRSGLRTVVSTGSDADLTTLVLFYVCWDTSSMLSKES